MASKTKKFSVEYIQKGFSALAPYYDRFNDWITFGLHRHWKRKVIQATALHAKSDGMALDICCGSGDISLLMAKKMKGSGEVVAIDFSKEMLVILENRLKKQLSKAKQDLSKVHIICQDASSLQKFPANRFLACTIGFGLRNVANRTRVLSEIFRVLESGKPLVVLDVGKVKYPVLRRIHHFYFEKIVPRIGYLLQGQKQSIYAYLPASAQNYPDQEGICQELSEIGFCKISYQNLLFGAAVIHIAYKP